MFGKSTYRNQLFLYFLLLFLAFSIIIGIFQYNREIDYKRKELQSMLSSYCDIVGKDELNPEGSLRELPHLISLLRDDIRITVIDFKGNVIYDNGSSETTLNSYLDRQEIADAIRTGEGYNIRMSQTLNSEFFYYAKKFKQHIVRAALPYDIEAKDLLQPTNLAFYFMGALFSLMLVFITLISDRMGKSIEKLRDFSLSSGQRETEIKFPKGEIGDIGNRIVELYQNINEEKIKVARERDKLTQHLKYSDEGIAIYSATGENIYANAQFIQIATLLTDMNTFHMVKVLEQEEFSGLRNFLNESKDKSRLDFPIRYQERIYKHSVNISLKSIIFEDQSFEILLNDVTIVEQNKIIKKEMTQSIAHELKTPVAALRGYLETLSYHDLPEEKRAHFIERALMQSERLTDLVNDISTITKLEEAPQLYKKRKTNLAELINQCVIDFETASSNKGMVIKCNIPDNLPFVGSISLLHSIFQNLIGNAIKYSGSGGKLIIDNYLQDDIYYYFSLSDNGKGVGEEHLTRIFERFYRVDDGRNRTTGGTGLGLSIVRNAVLFHGGEIKAKNHSLGGLEFLFTLKKGN